MEYYNLSNPDLTPMISGAVPPELPEGGSGMSSSKKAVKSVTPRKAGKTNSSGEKIYNRDNKGQFAKKSGASSASTRKRTHKESKNLADSIKNMQQPR